VKCKDCGEDLMMLLRCGYCLCGQGAKLEEAIKSKDNAYAERNKLVQFVSKLFDSHLARHPDSDTTWENDWRWIVCIHAPFGQMTWHIHDSQYEMFKHLPERPGDWDGHSTEEKYQRLESYPARSEINQ
jgi:hypothetical protein